MFAIIFCVYWLLAAAYLGGNQSLFELTGSTNIFASFLFFQMLGQVTISVLSGWSVDRFGYRKVLMCSLALIATAMAWSAISLYWVGPFEKTPSNFVGIFIAVAVFQASCHQPLFAWMGRHSCQDEQAQSYRQFTWVTQVAQITGVSSVLFIIDVIPFSVFLGLGALTIYILCFILLFKNEAKSTPATKGLMSNHEKAISFREQWPIVSAIFLLCAFPAVVTASFNISLPTYESLSVGKGTWLISIMNALFCAGICAIGLRTRSHWGAQLLFPRPLIVLACWFGLLFVTFLYSRSAVILIGASFMLGGAVSFLANSAALRLQSISDITIKGRLSSVQNILSTALIGLYVVSSKMSVKLTPFLFLILLSLFLVLCFIFLSLYFKFIRRQKYEL